MFCILLRFKIGLKDGLDYVLYIIKVGSDWKDGLDHVLYIIKVGSDLKDGLYPSSVILLRLDRT